MTYNLEKRQFGDQVEAETAELRPIDNRVRWIVRLKGDLPPPCGTHFMFILEAADISYSIHAILDNSINPRQR